MGKPRHKQRQHRVIVPLMRTTYDTKALELHLYVEACIESPCFDTLNTLAVRLAAITAAVFAVGGAIDGHRHHDNSIRQMAVALESAQVRFDAIGLWSVRGIEMHAMRQLAGCLDGAIRKLPFNVLRNAERFVDNILAGGLLVI